jgi:type I restriction enzyme S subunit
MTEAVTDSKEAREGYRRVEMGPKELEIPEDWRYTYFSDVVEHNPTYDKPDEGTFDFVPMDAVSEEEQRITYFTERKKDECTTTWFRNGDTIYPKITPCTENGKIAFVENVETGLASGSTEFVVFHPKEGETDSKFVYYLANMPQFRSVTISLMEGSTGRQRVPNDIFENNLQIPVPPLPEQRRIAAILSTVDEEIRETEEIIETTKQLKQGLMQDLYREGLESGVQTKESTYGEVPAHWSLSRIGEHARIVSGSHVKSDLVSSNEDLTPYLTGPDDFEGRTFHVSKYTDSPEKFCKAGDVLITVKGMGCGSTVLADQRAAISRQIKAIRPSDDLDKLFLFYWLRYREEALNILAEGTRQLGLSIGDIESFPLPLPDLDTQEQIGQALLSVDEKIQDEQRHKQELQELKRGLMQDLLTGHV